MLNGDAPSRTQLDMGNAYFCKLFGEFETALEKSFGRYSVLDFEDTVNSCTESQPSPCALSCLRLMLDFLPPISSFDWCSSALFREYLHCLKLDPTQNIQKLNLDLPDEDDLAFAFDHHSLITSQLPDAYNDENEPIKTAEEVIREIDLIMGNDDDIVFPPFGEPYLDAGDHQPNAILEANAISESDLEVLSLNQLNAFLEELEACVREYSAVLVQELAYREELDFEQEQKDMFIARLDEMHRRLERRRRRSSMPPINRTLNVNSGRGVIRQFDDGPEAEDFEASECPDHHSSEGPAAAPYHSTAPTPIFSRAQSAAHAAVTAASSATALLKRQWHRLSRGPEELANLDATFNHPSNQSFRQPDEGLDQSLLNSYRAATIVRLRKWASRKASEALHSGTSGSFRAFLRRTTKRVDQESSMPACIREARSAVTTPTSSPVEITIIPPTLTHSASGHLVGNQEMSAEMLEYKNLTTTIPYHRSPYKDGPTVEQLQVFNEMLLAILTNNPNLTPMLTDYILNIYAPAEERPSKLPI